MFFSKSTNGFYDPEFNAVIPEDAVEISKEYHILLINAQSQGKVITSNESGYPILIEPVGPSDEELAASIRSQRNSLLAKCDWTMLVDSPLSHSSAWKKYRQELRDITRQSTFPHSVEWPVSPK